MAPFFKTDSSALGLGQVDRPSPDHQPCHMGTGATNQRRTAPIYLRAGSTSLPSTLSATSVPCRPWLPCSPNNQCGIVLQYPQSQPGAKNPMTRPCSPLRPMQTRYTTGANARLCACWHIQHGRCHTWCLSTMVRPSISSSALMRISFPHSWQLRNSDSTVLHPGVRTL